MFLNYQDYRVIIYETGGNIYSGAYPSARSISGIAASAVKVTRIEAWLESG
jgi:hypothetical protein